MAKSHVYGRGRNKKHRPIGGGIERRSAANINMHGKKSMRMSCQCCECIDMRDKIIYNIHMKEIKETLWDRNENT